MSISIEHDYHTFIHVLLYNIDYNQGMSKITTAKLPRKY
jgi:hypothetical protein